MILAKCTFWKVAILKNKFSTYIWPNMHSGKCQLLENNFSGKLPFGQCTFWQESILQNKFSGKCKFSQCTFWQVSILENRFLEKCPFVQMSIQANVIFGKCFSGKCMIVRSGKWTFWKCIFRKMYIWDNVLLAKCFSGKCTFWKVFFGEMYRIPQSNNANQNATIVEKWS